MGIIQVANDIRQEINASFINDFFKDKEEEKLILKLKYPDIFEYSLLFYQVRSNRMYVRGDGNRYKDFDRIYANEHALTILSEVHKHSITNSLIDYVWEKLLEKKNAKLLGTVSGEFRSLSYCPVLKYKGMVIIKRHSTYLEIGSYNKLKNSNIWNLKPINENSN